MRSNKNNRYNFWIKLIPYQYKFGFIERYWKKLTEPEFDVHTKLHGSNVIMPSTYRYPVNCRLFPDFNNPLLELAYQTCQLKQKPINIIDAGAAIGDTFLLLKQNLTDIIGKIYCIEGDNRLSRYLIENVFDHPEAVIIPKLLSDKDDKIPSLIAHHSSSSISHGAFMVNAYTLDTIHKHKIREPIDLIKTDLDGFDGRALAGAGDILKEHSPTIIFEFHPRLTKRLGNDLHQPFNELKHAQYSTLLWYDKFGRFLQTCSIDATKEIEKRIDEGLSSEMGNDTHFDVIALKQIHHGIIQALESCNFAKHKTFPY